MLDELRQRADRGDDHALRALAGRLGAHNMAVELRALVAAAGADRQPMILQAAALANPAGINVLRMAADLGDSNARARLARQLAREGRAWMSYASAPKAGTNMPGSGWLTSRPRHDEVLCRRASAAA
jgi:hypothetical protein